MRLRDAGALVVCVCALYFGLQGVDEYELEYSWTVPLAVKHYKNHWFPQSGEHVPSPLVTDLDGDGVNELIVATREPALFVYDTKAPLATRDKDRRVMKDHLRVKSESSLLGKARIRSARQPIAMATGKLHKNDREQVVVVLTQDWTVMCFNSDLKLIWTHNPIKVKASEITHVTPSIVVAPVRLRGPDRGLVIVSSKMHVQDWEKHMKTLQDRSKTKTEGDQEDQDWGTEDADDDIEELEKLTRQSFFAFDGRHGGMRWKCTTEQMKPTQDAHETTVSQHNYKLTLHHELKHAGEVDWRQYRASVSKLLPHKWERRDDTMLELAHFSKRNRADHSTKQQRQQAAHDKEVGFRQRMFGPHPAPVMQHDEEHSHFPNVVVARAEDGLHVLHLFSGKILTTIALDPNASYGDINHDGSIDRLESVIGNAAHLRAKGHTFADFIDEGDDSDQYHCFLWATSGTPTTHALFNASICEGKSALMAMQQQDSDEGDSQPQFDTLAPVLLPRALGGKGAAYNIPIYDSVTYTSQGHIISYSPAGQHQWSVSGPTWSHSTEITGNKPGKSSELLLVPTAPTLRTLAKRPGTWHDCILAVGSRSMTLFGSEGEELADAQLVEPPVLPAVIADYNSDGLTDVIITTRNGVHGFNLERRASSGLLSFLLSGCVAIVVLATLMAVKDTEGFGNSARAFKLKRATD